ncbi:hypothetical protein WN48_10731 [Eufriesea mexicana]|uniref:Uncharacterized protein n=1 Tax=Eufriesea mexicana TaxID=516756 RepID=A0A310S6B0_9HYME|nr:hypothetical protein WN48_10731 [Eufriesea mexicana]
MCDRSGKKLDVGESRQKWRTSVPATTKNGSQGGWGRRGWLSRVASGIGSVGVFRSRAHRSLVNNPRKGRHYKPVISRVSGPLVCEAGPP